MIELRILEGNQAGGQWSTRHFPVQLGREEQADLVLTDTGVWGLHAEIAYDPASGFYITPLSEGTVVVNRNVVDASPLKSGDTFRLGAAVLQFWLTPPAQKRFHTLENGLWLALAALCVGQLLLIHWLSQ